MVKFVISNEVPLGWLKLCFSFNSCLLLHDLVMSTEAASCSEAENPKYFYSCVPK